MTKNYFLFSLLFVFCCHAFGQSAYTEGFDHPLLPGPGMDYTMTIDTGDYIISPLLSSPTDSRMRGRKEVDSTYTGFNYSNVTDSVTPGKINDRAAYPATGANGSPQYGIAHGSDLGMIIGPHYGPKPTREGTFVHVLHVANATITAQSMLHGDSTAKKFGGPDGSDPDWLLLTIRSYRFENEWSGVIVHMDSVKVYLADFRSSDSTEDFILKDWKTVYLLDHGKIDSLSFHLTSSDTDLDGMNTPAYFCVDDFGVDYIGDIGENKRNTLDASIYPNPTHHTLHIKTTTEVSFVVSDLNGRELLKGSGKKVSIGDLSSGNYVIKLTAEADKRSSAFLFTKK